MRSGVRLRLFLGALVLLLGAGLATGLYLDRSLGRWLEARIAEELLREARMTRALLDVAAPPPDVAAMDAVADRLGAASGGRVTIIAPDGRVLGDAELTVAEVVAVERHDDRPEVKAALADGVGRARRYSTTLGTDMLYVAVPATLAGGRGVVRIATPLTEVDATATRLRLILLAGGVIGLGVAVLLVAFGAHVVTRSLRRLVDHTRAVLAGASRQRVPVPATAELGRLAGSFNRLVDELDRTVSALGAERDHLATILQSMGDGVLVLDEAHRITRTNRAAHELLGLPADAVGRALLEVRRHPVLAELVLGNATEGARSVEFELEGGRTLLARAAPLQERRGCVVVLHDMTDLRRLETIRRDFVSSVSHELQTPVSVIRANAETLLDGALDDREQARVFVEALHRNVERLTLLITHLLELSRIEAGHYEVDLEPIALAPLVDTLLETLRGAAAGKELSLTNGVPADVRVAADRPGLEQVLLNLLDNAIKYTPAGGHVTVRAAPGGEGVRVRVEDDGPGIPVAHRARVFERFYRVDPGRSRDMGGTGLGLSIVKHLVALMGGRVGVDEGEAGGASFWFTLPPA